MVEHYLVAVQGAELFRRTGKVVRLSGLVVESIGPDCAVGEVCEVWGRAGLAPVRAEVVALKEGRVILMPYGELDGIGLDCEVVARAAGPGDRCLRPPAGRRAAPGNAPRRLAEGSADQPAAAPAD
jgi:flagellar biosynthesis/type III secretory pathway ATPase